MNFHTSLTDCPSVGLLQADKLLEFMAREQLWLDSVFNNALSCQLITVNNFAQGEYLRRPYEASSKIAQFGGGVRKAENAFGCTRFFQFGLFQRCFVLIF